MPNPAHPDPVPRPVLVGVDAGATKSVAIAVDPAGTRLGRAETDGANPKRHGLEVAADRIAAVAAAAMAPRTAPPDLLFVAGAGIDRPEHARALEGALQARLPGTRILVVNDTLAVLRAGTPDAVGLVVPVSTGGNVIGRAADGRVTDRGHGIFGGGYVLGALAARAARRAAVAPEPAVRAETPEPAVRAETPEPAVRAETPVPAVRAETPVPAVRAETRVPAVRSVNPRGTMRAEAPRYAGRATLGLELAAAVQAANLEWRGRRPSPDAARLGAAVIAAAEAGDPYPARMVRRWCGRVEQAVREETARLDLGEEPAVIVYGGLLDASPWLGEALRSAIRRGVPGARIRPLDREPAEGAALLAIDAWNGHPISWAFSPRR